MSHSNFQPPVVNNDDYAIEKSPDLVDLGTRLAGSRVG